MSRCSSRRAPRVELSARRSPLSFRRAAFGWSVYEWRPLCWPCCPVLITALICYIYAVCRASSSAWHRWQRQAEDNKGGCQLALQDLAVASVQWPQLVRGEMIPGLPAGLQGFYRITPPPLTARRGSRFGDLVLHSPPSSGLCLLIRN